MKKIKEIKVCKKIKNFAKKILKLLAIAAVFYGLVYVPYNLLAIERTNFIIAESRDRATCESLALQQLAVFVQNAEKEDKKVSESEKKALANNAYANCLRLAGRQYLLIPANNGQGKEADSKAENK